MLTEKNVIKYRTAMLAHGDIETSHMRWILNFWHLTHWITGRVNYTGILLLSLSHAPLLRLIAVALPYGYRVRWQIFMSTVYHIQALDWTICLLRAKYIHLVILFNFWTNSQTTYAALQHAAGLPSTPFIFTKLTVVQFILINYSYHYMYLGIQ